MINICVIGCGQWGSNHIRNFSNLPGSQVVAVADLDENRLKQISKQYPNATIQRNYIRLLEKEDIDAIVVATPTKSHYKITRDALEAGKHVLCEKPLCQTVEEGEEIVALAEKKGLILMVGHVFLFNPGILKLKQMLGDIGKIYYLSATRTNLGPIRSDVNSVHDLASHDISIFNFLLDSLPLEVSAVGMSFLQKGVEDVSFISMKYPNDILTNIEVSWLNPKKVRQITIVGDEKMATWDDLANIGPVMVFDKGVLKESYYKDYGEFQLLAREGDAVIPRVRMEEPLRIQAEYFLSCLEKGFIEISDGRSGLNVIRVITAAIKSISMGGHPVQVEY
ncbi:MAG: Gfo/Idh/MocA family protein [Ignavibacteriales bacterium]